MKRIGNLLIALLVLTSLSAQEEFTKQTFYSPSGDSLLYRWLKPSQMVKGKKYPLVLFLHGAGERGNDNQKQLVHGGQMFLNPVNRAKYPAFVLFPQCPTDKYWAYPSRPTSFNPLEMPNQEPITPILRTVKELLDSCIASEQVDTRRIYIIGLSMGGMGTFDLVIRFPHLFAAAIPICGTVRPARLDEAQSVPFRIFHGDADDIVPVQGSRSAYTALMAAGASVEYIEFPGINHNSWTPAFNRPDFMSWLFAQKKK